MVYVVRRERCRVLLLTHYIVLRPPHITPTSQQLHVSAGGKPKGDTAPSHAKGPTGSTEEDAAQPPQEDWPAHGD